MDRPIRPTRPIHQTRAVAHAVRLALDPEGRLEGNRQLLMRLNFVKEKKSTCNNPLPDYKTNPSTY